MAVASPTTENVEPVDASPSRPVLDTPVRNTSPSVPLSSSPAEQCDPSNSSLASQADSEIQSAAALRSEEYRQLFRLPPEEVLVEDFNCACQENILVQGHMYLFVHYICFYSNIFGFETKKIIHFSEVTSVKRAKTAGIFPNAIEIFAGGKKHFFASFLSRDEAFKLIVDGWVQHGNGAKAIMEKQDSASESSFRENGSESEKVKISDIEDDMDIKNSEDASAPEDSKLLSTIEDGNPSTAVPDLQGNVECAARPTPISDSSSSAQPWTWKVEDSDAPMIPECFTKVAESKFQITVEKFFNLFFSDDAVGFMESFHKKCGDKEFKCSEWSPHDQFGHTRNVSFQHPIKLYLGAKFGSTQEMQKYRVYKNSHLVIDTSQEINDVPYGDYFRVEGLWDVCKDGEEYCNLSVYTNVAFSKKTMFRDHAKRMQYLQSDDIVKLVELYDVMHKLGNHDLSINWEEFRMNIAKRIKHIANFLFVIGKIVQSTLEECREAYAIWVNMAHELLRERNLEKKKGKVGNGPDVSMTQSREVQSEKQVKTVNPLEPSADANNDLRVQNCSTGPCHINSNNLVQGNGVNSTFTIPMLRETVMKFWRHIKSQTHLPPLIAISFAVILLMQLSIVMLLSRPQNIQVISQTDYTGGFRIGDRPSESVAWLEKRVHHLKDEMAMVESRLERMQWEHARLKEQLRDLQQLEKQQSK